MAPSNNDAGPSASFINWWFSPWNNGGPALPESCLGELARRDAYQHWCRQAAIAPDLPQQADWQWQATAALNGDTLLRAAELFGGLLAARRHRHDELAELAPARRRWCLAVAMTQPLVDWSQEPATAEPQAAASPTRRGLLELALRLECAVPGLWSRMALMLPAAVRPNLSQALAGDAVRSLRERDRRCWLMCLAQAYQA